MEDTTDHREKIDGETKVEKEKQHEKKEKHADMNEKEEKGEHKGKDKKKKDTECKDKEGVDGKEKKKKNPENKTDPAILKQKLEKIDMKMQAMALKREDIVKLINEVEKNTMNPSGASTPHVLPRE